MDSPYLNNPDAALPLALDPDAPERDARMLEIARALVPAWAGAESASIEAIPGGITNLLFKLSAPGCPPILARLYGRNTEVVIDRAAENRLFARLSRLGFAPTFYGRFANGRIEGFWEGYRALQPHEMGQPRLRRLIAAKLREMHAIPPDAAEPRLWSRLGRWMAAAQAVTFADPARQAAHAALDLPRYAALLADLQATYRDEIAPRAASAGARAAHAAVLAHNDLLSGNVLYSAEEGAVRFIDYEYGGCSYAAFDVANHFCEYAGFDSDFERGFPAADVRRDFIAAYLGAGASGRDIDDFARIVEFFVVPDHLFWGTWAVVQARHSPIDFDFLGYAGLRLAGCDLHLPFADIRK